MKRQPAHITFKIGMALLCAFSFMVNGTCQNSFQDSVFSANNHIYHFRFKEVEPRIKELIQSHPGDYLPWLLSANFYWWQIISGTDNNENRTVYYKHLDSAMQNLQATTRENCSNDSLYALITTFAYKARIHAMNNQYFSALGQLNSCIDFVKRSFGKEKDYEWFLLSTGLYNYYIEAVKTNYPFLRPYLLFLPKGNEKTGLAFLEKASHNSNRLLKTEAAYFLMKINLEEERNFSAARTYSGILLEEYPGNLLYRYYQFKSFLQEGNIEQASRELGILSYYANQNDNLSDTQKKYFQEVAREDLRKYYQEKKN